VKNSQCQSGFALALLLWTIAGMSLMVTAVIHFARDDTGMVELRLKEAKSLAISRGAALLAVRDRSMRNAMADAQVRDLNGEESGENGAQQGFNARYEFPEIGSVQVQIRPGSGYVSLNSASPEELAVMFSGIGGVADFQAEQMAMAVLEYREGVTSEAGDRTFSSGFQYSEELLSVPGVGRGVYDKVRRYVHPYRSGDINPNAAPGPLQKLFSGDQATAEAVSGVGGDATMNGGGAGSAGASGSTRQGLVTFDSIWEEKRQGAGGGGGVAAVEVSLIGAAGERTERRVWVSTARNRIVRAEPASFSDTAGKQ
jgi:DNA uptake protein ComE-like DNA-binding protein